MGQLFFKQCLQPEKQDEQRKSLHGSVIVKSNLIYESPNRISQVQFALSPENNMLGISVLDNSTINSFYKENEIGPFLVQPERSNSYKEKIKKWKSVIQTCPRPKEQEKCTNCQSFAGINNNVLTVEKPKNNCQNEQSFVSEKNDQETMVSHKCGNKANKKNSFDVNAFQKTFQFVSNRLDTAIVSFNIMDKQGFKQIKKKFKQQNRESLLEGPPNMCLRWSCWKTSLLMNIQKKDFEASLSLDLCSEINETIQKDIKRTITSHKVFQSAQNEGSFAHEQLFRLLKGISNTFPALGYCQGMNFLAAFLLIASGDERQTFQCLVQLLQSPKFMVYHIFSPGLPFLIYLETFTNELITQHFPKARQHFTMIELPNSFWITKMILSLFLYCFNIKTCLRLWDFIFATNIFGVVSLILAFLDVNQNDILQLDIGEFMCWFQNKQDEDLNTREIITLASEKYKINKLVVARSARKFKNPSQFVQILGDFHDKQKFYQEYKQLIQRDTNLYIETQNQNQSIQSDYSEESNYQKESLDNINEIVK